MLLGLVGGVRIVEVGLVAAGNLSISHFEVWDVAKMALKSVDVLIGYMVMLLLIMKRTD